MTGLAILLVAAAIAFGLAQALRAPLIPLLLLSGVMLHMSGLSMPEDVAQSVLEIGLAVLVFGAGMELNPKRFGGQFRPVLGIGIVQFVAVGLAGVCIAWSMGQDWIAALYIGLAVTTSSTLIIVRLLKTRQQMFEPFGRVVTGVLLIQDLFIVLMIVLLIRVPEGWGSIARGLASLSVLLALAYSFLRWLMPYVMLRTKLDHETLGLAIMAVLFMFMWAAHLLGLPIITGAFLAGVSLSTFPINSIARGMMTSLSTFFLALFFVVLGAIIDVTSAQDWINAALLAAMILVLTPTLVALIGERLGLTARASIESGLLLAMTSEFSLVVVLQGLMTGQIQPVVFNVVALATVITMTITPLIATDRFTWTLMRLNRRTRPREVETLARLNNHVVLLGYGRGGSVVLKALRAAGQDLVVVDDDPVVLRELEEQGVPTVRGDGSDKRILAAVNARQARAIISSMRRVSDTESALRHLNPGGPPVITRVFDPEDAERIRAQGGIPVLSSTSAAEAFMNWYRYTQKEPEAEQS